MLYFNRGRIYLLCVLIFFFLFSESGITEDAVRRYLMRKPMTTTELLQKLKSKKSGMSSQEMVTRLTQILKNINPHIQNIQNKKYLSIRPA